MTELLADVMSAHRIIRVIPPGEGAFAGTLVTDGERTAVAVGVEDLAGSTMWRWAGADHIGAPMDVALGDDGAQALLPWCRERVSTMLARRVVAGEAFGSGEVVTLVVSMLRGLAELREDPAGVTGQWWLTDAAKPVFVVGEGPTAAEAVKHLVEEVATRLNDRRLSRVLGELTEALARTRAVVREGARWESELLECAAPCPLRVDVYAPATARSLAAVPVTDGVLRDDRERMPRLEAFMSKVDAWRERFRGFLPIARRVLPPAARRTDEPETTTRSRKPLVVGAVAAAVVIGGGALWPAAADDVGEPSLVVPVTDAAPFDGDADEHGADDEPAPVTDGDVGDADATPLGSLPRLLNVATACAESSDAACAAAVADGSAFDLDRLAAHAARADAATLVDDYGDIAVLRLPATEEASELILVLARINDIWLFRDLYEVAEQPE